MRLHMDWLYSQRFRAVSYQLVLFILVLYSAHALFTNMQVNMAARGISSGFHFLSQRSGFDIGFTLFEYSPDNTYYTTFFVGITNTLLVSVMSIVTATIVGFLCGVLRISKNWLVCKLADCYVEIFRNIPLLLQLFFWYFAVLSHLPGPKQSYHWSIFFLNLRGLYFPAMTLAPGAGLFIMVCILTLILAFAVKRYALTHRFRTGKPLPVLSINLLLIIVVPVAAFYVIGHPLAFSPPVFRRFNFTDGLNLPPEFVALWIGLTVYTAAYIAEIVRAGILSVNIGQKHAALSLGMTGSQVIRLVIVPQAMRVIIPPLTSQYLNIVKNSSLAMAIGFADLVNVFAGTALNQTGRAVEIIVMTMSVYLVISLSIAALMNLYNKRVIDRERGLT